MTRALSQDLRSRVIAVVDGGLLLQRGCKTLPVYVLFSASRVSYKM